MCSVPESGSPPYSPGAKVDSSGFGSVGVEQAAAISSVERRARPKKKTERGTEEELSGKERKPPRDARESGIGKRTQQRAGGRREYRRKF
jgi:hypothetical protein